MQQINYFPHFKCLRIVSSYHVRSLVSLVLFVLFPDGLSLLKTEKKIFSNKRSSFSLQEAAEEDTELRFNRNLGQSLGQTNQTSSSSSSSIIYNNDDNNKKSLLTFCFAFGGRRLLFENSRNYLKQVIGPAKE